MTPITTTELLAAQLEELILRAVQAKRSSLAQRQRIEEWINDLRAAVVAETRDQADADAEDRAYYQSLTRAGRSRER